MQKPVAFRFVVMFSLSLLLLAGCLRSDYQKLVDRELASGVRADSLFLGISFGMTAKEFYDHCWQLNKDSVIKEGTGNASVKYMPEGFPSDVSMLFYPNFSDSSRIVEMPILFAYDSWAPWNQQYSADSLLPRVLEMFTDWYGGEFLKVEHPERGVVWVKVDGNRRIRVFKKDLQYVRAVITDLTWTNESEA